jgi:hypothetical protein
MLIDFSTEKGRLPAIVQAGILAGPDLADIIPSIKTHRKIPGPTGPQDDYLQTTISGINPHFLFSSSHPSLLLSLLMNNVL